MNYGAKGLALTKLFESCRLAAYQDVAGRWTIGYGHTGPEVVSGLTWTQAQADAQLVKDIAWAQSVVNSTITEPINQNQNDALVDFVYNVGSGNFISSHLRIFVNEGEFAQAAQQFGLWIHAGGVEEEGLVRRRAAEVALFEEAA